MAAQSSRLTASLRNQLCPVHCDSANVDSATILCARLSSTLSVHCCNSNLSSPLVGMILVSVFRKKARINTILIGFAVLPRLRLVTPCKVNRLDARTGWPSKGRPLDSLHREQSIGWTTTSRSLGPPRLDAVRAITMLGESSSQ